MKTNLIVILVMTFFAALIAAYSYYFKVDEQAPSIAHGSISAISDRNPNTIDATSLQSGPKKNKQAIIGEASITTPPSLGGATAIAFERNLLSNASLDANKVRALLLSKKFDAQLDQFSYQSATDADASDLSALYRKMLEKQIQKNHLEAQIDRLVCGTQLCAGSLRNGSDSEYTRWTQIFFADPNTPHFSLLDATVERARGEFDHRFVFSTDPAANSIVVPRQYP